jgi:hypothetical protein
MPIADPITGKLICGKIPLVFNSPGHCAGIAIEKVDRA